MKDEISKARSKRKRRARRKKTLRLLMLAAALLLTVTAMLLFKDLFTQTALRDVGDFFSTLFRGGGYPVVLSTDSPIQTEKMSMSYAVLTKSRLSVYSSAGGENFSVEHHLSAPCIAAGSNRVVLYNAGSRDVSIYNRHYLLAELQADHAVVDAAVAGRSVALLTQSERYSCHLEVYEGGNFVRSMTWNGVTGFPLAVALRSDGQRAAVIRMSLLDGRIVSMMAVINLQTQEQIYESTLQNLVTDLYFDRDVVVAVTDKGVMRMNGETVASSYDFGVMPLLAVACENGPIAVALGDNNSPDINEVVLLDRSLEVRCLIHHVGVVRELAVTGNRIYVLGERLISEYNLRGELQHQYEADADTKKILHVNGVLVFGSDSIERAQLYESTGKAG